MKVTPALHKLRGSIHPEYFKGLAKDKSIETLPMPKILHVSMAQHLGAPAKPIVKKGDILEKGQRIGEAVGFISAHVHTPVSGTVTGIEDRTTPTGAVTPHITISADHDETMVATEERDWESQSRETLLEWIADAGVAGMGGAGFPTRVKLSPPTDKPIDTLIVNGAECEPYLTADHRVMIEGASELRTGIAILRKILNVKTVIIAVEANKPEAIQALQDAMIDVRGTTLCILKTEYPQGAEKQQIYATTGREVPSGGLPMDVGCVVENVSTVQAVFRAVTHGTPLLQRVITVTGDNVKEPKNILVPLGTPFKDLLDFCGGLTGPVSKVICGGPMMGIAQSNLDATTTKTTSGLLFLAQERVTTFASTPCISCGRCVEACPMGLLPAELSNRIEAGDDEATEALNVLDCIECGCCAFTCPAYRPLVQHMKLGKSKIMLKRRQEQINKRQSS